MVRLPHVDSTSSRGAGAGCILYHTRIDYRMNKRRSGSAYRSYAYCYVMNPTRDWKYCKIVADARKCIIYQIIIFTRRAADREPRRTLKKNELLAGNEPIKSGDFPMKGAACPCPCRWLRPSPSPHDAVRTAATCIAHVRGALQAKMKNGRRRAVSSVPTGRTPGLGWTWKSPRRRLQAHQRVP